MEIYKMLEKNVVDQSARSKEMMKLGCMVGLLKNNRKLQSLHG